MAVCAPPGVGPPAPAPPRGIFRPAFKDPGRAHRFEKPPADPGGSADGHPRRPAQLWHPAGRPPGLIYDPHDAVITGRMQRTQMALEHVSPLLQGCPEVWGPTAGPVPIR
ncbi:MAG: hypothetical protein JWO38_1614 [Gemmataceae bacterium]|nr:hypothetical protein [Gemmataceae bacterium]